MAEFIWKELARGTLHRWTATLLSGALLLVLGSGCLYQRYQTHSKRSATEQLLLSRAVHQAVARLKLPELAGRRVALETVSLAGPDASYLEGVLVARLRAEGARVVDPGEAELILVVLNGVLGTAGRDLSFGIPPLPLPTGVASPALSLMRVLKQRGYTQLRLVAYDRSGAAAGETETVMGRASFEIYSILFFAIRRNDIYPGERFQITVD